MTPSASKAPDRVGIGLALILALGLTTCTDTEGEELKCEPGSYKCVGHTAMRCVGDGSGYTVETDCSLKGQRCTTRGCLFCDPGVKFCKGQDLMMCNSEGSAYLAKPLLTCDASKGEICEVPRCVQACERAAKNRSYVGCEYWAVDLDNAVVSSGSAAAQQFAVALSNPSSLAASVTVSINEAAPGVAAKTKVVTTRTVKPNGLEVILLPSREVDGSPAGQFNTGGGTALTSNAYKIVSSAPIIAYQFNPLSNAGVFSNDASLLVPTPALTKDSKNLIGAPYLVMGWPQTIATSSNPKQNFGDDLRAFLTIVGTRDKTQVQVQLSTAIVGDKEGKVKAAKKGDTVTYTLGPYDVLNLETGGFNADFTGTKVVTDKPVAVFSGSEASDVPDFDDLTTRKCCADHLEQQLFPETTFGRVFIALTTPMRSEALFNAGATITVAKSEKDYFRVISDDEQPAITTNLPGFTSVQLRRGEVKRLDADRDFTIEATDPISVGQFVAGQDEVGIPSTLPGGDPSFILLPPVEQFRKDYLFLTPDKYSFDFIMVGAPKGATVTLDGRPLKAGCDSSLGKKLCCKVGTVGSVRMGVEVGKTEFVSYKCQLSFPTVQMTRTPPDNLLPGEQNDGIHRLKSDQAVGLVVYGFDAYVSYGYPGGTDLALINID